MYYFIISVTQITVCGLRSAVCGLRSAVCSLWSAVCSLQMSYTAPYLSPGDSIMDVRAFIMLLLWSEKEYGLLTSNLLRLDLRGLWNNGLTFSFNCLFTSNILWVENDTCRKIIKVGFVLRACRLLLAKRRVSQYSRIRNLLRSPDHKEEL